jgi:putative sterol carrier protein
VLTCTDKVLLDLCAGRQDYASAQLTGKVRIEGSPMDAMVLQGALQQFRRDEPGPRGAVARGLRRWIAGPTQEV